MQTVAEKILSEAKTLQEGALISAKEFLHLGSRAAVDQALKRLKERKELMPLYRGVYVRPVKTRFGTRAPAAEKVVERIAATRKPYSRPAFVDPGFVPPQVGCCRLGHFKLPIPGLPEIGRRPGMASHQCLRACTR